MKPIYFKKRSLGVMVVLFLVLFPQVSGATMAPLEQMRETVAAILDIMQDESLDDPVRKEERRARLMALVNHRFDFMQMSRMTLGNNWLARTSEERTSFQKLFSDLLKNNYIGRIEAYSDEKVEFAKEVFSRRHNDRAKVYTNIIKNGREIHINYSLHHQGEEWFVYDVVIEGVSLVRNYRTEFGRIIDKEKFPGLIERMQEKIERNEVIRKK